MSAYPMRFRLRLLLADSPSLPAESSSSPADRQLASGCPPPRLTMTQLPSATGSWLTPTRTCTVLLRAFTGALGTANSPRLAHRRNLHGISPEAGEHGCCCFSSLQTAYPLRVLPATAHPCGRGLHQREQDMTSTTNSDMVFNILGKTQGATVPGYGTTVESPPIRQCPT